MSAEDTTPTMDNSTPGTEAELEAFRRQWREEVSARNKKPSESAPKPHVQPKKERQQSDAAKPTTSIAGPSTARRKDEYSEELEPRTYHDLPDKELQLQLGVEGLNHDRDLFKEPSSALEHYERAVEKETQGNLSESMRHYRRAFKVGPLSLTTFVVENMLR
jgi:F-box protein 9